MSGPGESAPPPQQPAAPPPASPPPPPGPSQPSGMPAWTSNITSTAPVAGPAGLFYADVPNRIIALIIDGVILFVAFLIVQVVIEAILGPRVALKSVADPNSVFGVRIDVQTNYLSSLVVAAINLVVSAGYFVYTWTTMRASLGQRLLGMQVGNAADGATITMEQAIRRWVALFGIFSITGALNPIPLLGLLIGLAGIVWVIALIVTTAQSPTKQGLHDQFANTIVVKAARAVG